MKKLMLGTFVVLLLVGPALPAGAQVYVDSPESATPIGRRTAQVSTERPRVQSARVGRSAPRVTQGAAAPEAPPARRMMAATGSDVLVLTLIGLGIIALGVIVRRAGRRSAVAV